MTTPINICCTYRDFSEPCEKTRLKEVQRTNDGLGFARYHRIDRNGLTSAGMQHAANFRRPRKGSGKNISPRSHSTASKLIGD
jgi:hypothetical protein